MVYVVGYSGCVCMVLGVVGYNVLVCMLPGVVDCYV